MAKKTKIMIVDDDRHHIALLKSTLQKLNYEIVGTANTGKQGIKRVKALNPDLVLMDICMESEFAGIDAAAKLRSIVDIPVIFLTAMVEDTFISKAIETHPYGYITKPFRKDDLKPAIEVSLTRYNYEKKLGAYQRKIEESEALFRGIYNNHLSGYFQLDRDFKIIMLNPYLLKILNYGSEKEITGENIFDFFYDEQYEGTKLQKQLKESGEINLTEAKWITKNNRVIQVFLNIKRVNNKNDNTESYIGFTHDITQHKQLEYQLRHAQKMEIIGTLSGLIAHEINNQLTNVLGYADLCRMTLKKTDKQYKYVQSIQIKAREAAGTLRHLLKFSRIQKPSVKEFDLDKFITNKIDLFSQIAGSKIKVSADLNCPGVLINTDTRLFEQVLMNLIINAKDAIADSGKITMSSKIVSDDKDSILYYKLPKNKYVNLSIQDNGSGIQTEIINKIFDPFFTTKDESTGTGLGLAIVKSILKDIDGYIFVESQVKKGTNFELFIPINNTDKTRPTKNI
ncbi:MAG: response regulator [Candidatus Marinimicrobia bacterium]|nr:response regulator [Candidatus Neomarinimicrobiota bacterium]